MAHQAVEDFSGSRSRRTSMLGQTTPGQARNVSQSFSHGIPSNNNGYHKSRRYRNYYDGGNRNGWWNSFSYWPNYGSYDMNWINPYNWWNGYSSPTIITTTETLPQQQLSQPDYTILFYLTIIVLLILILLKSNLNIL